MKILAKDIMSTAILSVQKGTTVEDALKILINKKITGIPVVDRKGKMVGVFSDYDVIQQLEKDRLIGEQAFRKPIEYSTNVEAVYEKTPLETIISLFVRSRYRRLPVLNKEKVLTGIITRRDLMRLFYYQAKLS